MSEPIPIAGPTPADTELQAMATAYEALRSLHVSSRSRAVLWLNARLEWEDKQRQDAKR